MFDTDYRIPTEKQNKKIIGRISKNYGGRIKWYSTVACKDYKKICLAKYKYIPEPWYVKEKLRASGNMS